MSSYANVVGGRLKLKKPIPGMAPGGPKPVKSAVSNPSASSASGVLQGCRQKRPLEKDESAPSQKRSRPISAGENGTDHESAASAARTAVMPSVLSDTRTPAQRAFEETQAARLTDKARKLAPKSHSDRVAEFNALLEKLPEHNDLFKIQYAGTG